MVQAWPRTAGASEAQWSKASASTTAAPTPSTDRPLTTDASQTTSRNSDIHVLRGLIGRTPTKEGLPDNQARAVWFRQAKALRLLGLPRPGFGWRRLGWGGLDRIRLGL